MFYNAKPFIAAAGDAAYQLYENAWAIDFNREYILGKEFSLQLAFFLDDAEVVVVATRYDETTSMIQFENNEEFAEELRKLIASKGLQLGRLTDKEDDPGNDDYVHYGTTIAP